MTPSEFAQIRDLLAGISGEVRKVHVRLDRLESAQLDFQDFVARHFARLEDRIGALEDRVGALEGRIDAVEDRLTRLETRVEQIQSDFRAFGEELRSTNRKVDELRDEMNRRFDEERDLTQAGFRDWGARVERIEARLGEAA